MATQKQETLFKMKLGLQEAVCTFVKVYVPFFILKEAFNEMKLKRSSKEFSPEMKTITVHIEEPPKLESAEHKVDYDRFGTGKLVKVVSEFVDVLEKNFPPEVLDNFYRNINYANIRINFFHRLKNDDTGHYKYDKQNQTQNISVCDPNFLFHELFHLASSIPLPNGILSGFTRTETHDGGTYSIGNGLNEGYTELMARRYFGDKYPMGNGYKLQRQIAENLEAIVGREKMEAFYLSSNLNGLIEELTKYASEEEVLSFITSLDATLDAQKFHIADYEKHEDLLKNINLFLLKAFTKKQSMRVENHEITEDQRFEEERAFVANLVPKATIGRFDYSGQSEELSFVRVMLGIEDDYDAHQIKEMLDEHAPKGRR